MIRLFEDLILEGKGVNDTVLKYTKEIFSKLKLKKENFTIDLVSGHDLKLRNLKIIITEDLEKGDYAFIKTNNKIIEDKFLDDFELHINIIDWKSEEKILSNINHELVHALEVYITSSNKRKIHKSWKLAEKLNKHKLISKSYTGWKDFNYLIYLTLKRETNSHASELYHDLENKENLEQELKNNKIYKDCLFYLNQFTFQNFYDRFLKYHNEKDFVFLTQDFCHNFGFKKPKNLEESKDCIKFTIENLQKKLKKFKIKLERVIKRLQENQTFKEYETYRFNHQIDYNEYQYISKKFERKSKLKRLL